MKFEQKHPKSVSVSQKSEENHLCRYFQDSLPFGSGPGTDTDLVSVMNGEGNRRFDEVFRLD